MVYGTGPATVCWGGRPVGERVFCVGCHGTKNNRDVDRSKCGPLAIIDRLAAYEDTGLGPDEITTEPYGCVFYCNRKCNLDGDWCAEGPGCPYEIGAETAKRLLELARAEKDGRLVMLPPNDPLTLEELREMDGEPVWVEHCNGGEWVVVAWNIHDEIAGARQARLDADNYGSDGLGGWLAYRRKPEEGMP